jgi:DNA polymerase III delta prime subunit
MLYQKTMEEPPDNVIFIFATTEPQKVLPTLTLVVSVMILNAFPLIP